MGQKKKINCYSFTAESEREKEEWIEAVQESIAETLSDYEVAEKVWFNESNGSCADCRAPQPEWASINLGVVICKKCAGKKERKQSDGCDAAHSEENKAKPSHRLAHTHQGALVANFVSKQLLTI